MFTTLVMPDNDDFLFVLPVLFGLFIKTRARSYMCYTRYTWWRLLRVALINARVSVFAYVSAFAEHPRFVQYDELHSLFCL